MVFSSSLFLFYFLPFFLLAYFLIDNKYKNLSILAFSIFFYAWGAPDFISILLITTFIDFHIVKLIHNAEGKKRGLFLFCSISINLGLLIYFKYSNFFISNLNQILATEGIKTIKWVEIILPIGISFFTFETLTYSIDVYRRVHAPLPKFRDYLLYIILFPKLIAGPIVRFSEIADQVIDRKNQDTLDNKVYGFYRFIIGLSKKVLIANTMGSLADSVFNIEVNSLSTFDTWIGIIAYSFQIYFDFSGYSDMAIGLARVMGFKFPENFNNPYISRSITEFWRRWHMTLGRWMRDYLYIPLGGNKVSTWRMYLNLWFVFLISGLWHGASWNFVIWGAFHGSILILDRLFLVKFLNKLGRIPSVLITYILVLIGWVFFRISDFQNATYYISKMFDFNGITHTRNIYLSNEHIIIFVFAILFSFVALIPKIENNQDKYFNQTYGLKSTLGIGFALTILFFMSILKLSISSFNPFIYFQF